LLLTDIPRIPGSLDAIFRLGEACRNQFTVRNYQAGVPDNAYLAGMQRKNAHIDIRVGPQGIERTDAGGAGSGCG
jgi:hypothetical protein